MKLRKCFVLREVEVPFKDLKKGDIFRLNKATKKDPVVEKEWSLVEENAKEHPPKGNSVVKCSEIAFVVNARGSLNFRK